jgi:hypothetical protein
VEGNNVRGIRTLIWATIVVLGLFLVVSPFLTGLQETANQVTEARGVRDGQLSRVQGGTTADDLGDRLDTTIKADALKPSALRSFMKSRTAKLAALVGLTVTLAMASISKRYQNHKALQRVSRPPSTAKAAPATYADPLYGAPASKRPAGAPTRALVDRVETLGSVGLLAHLAADQPTAPVGRQHRK